MPGTPQPIDYSSLAESMAGMQSQVQQLQQQPGTLDRVSLLVFSGDMDKLIAAYVIATGAAAMGSEVNLFFTFWGSAAVRKRAPTEKKFLERAIGWMVPRHSKRRMSKLHFGGIGPRLINHLMTDNGVPTLDEMIDMAPDLGVNVSICTMSMDLLGFKEPEFAHVPDVTFCGVATFLERAGPGRITLFI